MVCTSTSPTCKQLQQPHTAYVRGYERTGVELSMAVANWSDAEVLHVIDLWGEEGIQQQLEGAKRNKHVYEKLARPTKDRK